MPEPKRILISGSSGFLGTELCAFLKQTGYAVSKLTRKSSASSSNVTCPDELFWNPEEQSLEPKILEDLLAVIHLSGENIFSPHWSAAKKRRLYDSRVKTTNLMAQSICKTSSPPKIFITASAIGFYGDRGDEILTEESKKGTGFFPDLGFDWEAQSAAVEALGVRVVKLRIGVVLSPKGGALKTMYLPFKLGLGGKLGRGNQYMSWISLDDFLGIVLFILKEEKAQGPINAVAPTPVTNLEFTKALGEVLKRPTFFGVPAFMLRAALGELADEALLSSVRVIPKKLNTLGFRFRHESIESALNYYFG